ncbi:MAG: acetate/propionate family kinase, partial [Lachnospiraceae bacterium]|nr:acetate/propionate family kinase [Lachnospiraceae bacterium]
IYGIPDEYYTKYKIRTYGFHGTSHAYVSKRTAKILGLDYNKAKIIVCHLGNGASICAVDGGKSVETSMGLTPLMGLIMGTRSGEIDPGVMEFIHKKEGLDLEGVMNILNKRSGVLGLSGLSSDFRDIDSAIEDGNEQAKVAKDAFVHRVVNYIGAYIAVMNGVDAIAFTAGVGENDPDMRKDVMSHFTYMGAKVDEELNKCRGVERVISTDDSAVKVLVVPTNEELMIARDTERLVLK